MEFVRMKNSNRTTTVFFGVVQYRTFERPEMINVMQWFREVADGNIEVFVCSFTMFGHYGLSQTCISWISCIPPQGWFNAMKL